MADGRAAAGGRAVSGAADLARPDLHQMEGNAERASQLLKAIASPTRLMLLCALGDAEMSVSELTDALGLRQATVSQHLARLRQEGLVSTRRDAQSVYYRIADATAEEIVAILYRRFCAD